MALTSRARLICAAAVTGSAFLYVQSRIRQLEKRYPPLPPDASSTLALRTPREQGRYTPHVDIYSTRVPLSGLKSADSHKDSIESYSEPSLEESWARSFFSSRAMRWEGTVFKRGSLIPDDLGEGSFQPGQGLLGGLMCVLRAPSPGSPLLVEWRMPSHITRFFERLARWGYPWRLMDGGRHEWGVEVVRSPEGNEEVEVRFAAAHDYRIVEGEGPEGKVIPHWVQWLHRAYARFLLDQAVEQIRLRATEHKSL